MTEYYSFVPQPNAPFIFYPTLDGVSYTASVTWNFSGNRYYISVFSGQGQRILTLPVIGSVEALQASSVSWENGRAKVVTTIPHGLEIGSVVRATLRGFRPEAYDGVNLRLLVVNETTFTYDLASNPGDASSLGNVSQEVDIVGGYFDRSTLVFREKNQTFEVNP